MTSVSVRMKGLPQLRKDVQNVGKKWVPDKLKVWFADHGKRMSDDMKRGLKRGGKGRYTGRWAAAMGFSIDDKGQIITMKVGANATGQHHKAMSYGPYVEGYPQPPRRHFLPFRGHGDFADWARRVAGLRRSQIDDSPSGGRSRRSAGGHTAARRSRHTSPSKIPWRERKKIKGLMVGGPKSIRPTIRPAVRRNIPLMAKDARRILSR